MTARATFTQAELARAIRKAHGWRGSFTQAQNPLTVGKSRRR